MVVRVQTIGIFVHFLTTQMIGSGFFLTLLYPSLVTLFLFPAGFLLTIDNKENAGDTGSICGAVRTSTNKTVILREGVGLTAEEFENVHLRQLKGAMFSPEENCTIKVCGYTWTEKPFQDSQIGILTRNYADCEVIKKPTSKVSSNIYNDAFNVTSISCGCKRNVSDCKVTCLNRVKMKIEWKENQCAILYEETSCGHCWFPPVLLYQGENYTTNNSHFINTVILREHCKGEQSFRRKSGLRRSHTVFFDSSFRVTDKSAYQSDFSTFKCKCPNNFTTTSTIIAPPATPTTTAASNDVTALLAVTTNDVMISPSTVSFETTVPTSALRPSTLVSCASIKPAMSPAVELFENNTIGRFEFEKIRVGKLRNAMFSVGKNWNDPVNCILEICGFSKIAFNNGTCEWYTKGDREAPSEIYMDDYEVNSLSCSCTTAEDFTNCQTNKCFAKNATVSWQDQECAVMYREGNCNSCYFKPIILQHNQPFYSLNSYKIKSIVVRPECTVEVATKASENGQWADMTKKLTDIILETGTSYYKDTENFTCQCNPASKPTPENLARKPTTVGSSTTSEESISSCASIKPRPSGTPAVTLFENGIIDKDAFESIRVGKLENAFFAPEASKTDPRKCALEICGFGSTSADKYKYGSCELYHGAQIRAPAEIYDKYYEVSSVGCACRAKEDLDCNAETCLAKNSTQVWNGKVCAIMFQEEDCQACYFKPIKLLYGKDFLSLNSYQIKSTVIRPGCQVEQETKGSLWYDAPYIFKYENTTSKIGPTFHKDSENFTCTCSLEVLEDMLSETTTEEHVPETEEPVTTTEEPVTPTVEQNITPVELTTSTTVTPVTTALSITKYIVFSVGSAVILVLAAFLIIRYRKKQISPNNENVVKRSTIDQRDSGREMFSVETISFRDEPTEINPVSDKMEETEMSSIFEQGIEETNDDLKSLAEVVKIENNQEISQNEHLLKMKIMDEVKRLMESFGLMGQDEPEAETLSVLAAARSTEESDRKFRALVENFHQICRPEHVLTRNMFSIPNRNWERPVGKGQVGIVYKGQMRLEPDGLVEKMAVKKIKWPGSPDSVMQSFLREIKAFESIGVENDFIVKFFGACCDPDGLYILTKFCEGGSLRGHLLDEMRPKVFPNEGTEDNGDGYFMTPAAMLDLPQLLDWCAQISCAMEYLSKKGIIHVDLAVRNILLSDDNTVKICDFGLSKMCLNEDDCAQSLLTGDFPFNSFAPECNTENIYEPRQISLHLDVWAFGCTVWEMFTLGDSLYQVVQEEGLYKFLAVRKLLLKGYRHPKPELAPTFVYEKLLECWSEVPKDRPNFTHLCHFFETKRLEVAEKSVEELQLSFKKF